MEESQIQQGAGKHHQALKAIFFSTIRFSLHIHTIFASLRHINLQNAYPFAPIIIIDGGYKNMDKTLCDLLLSVYNFRILP